MQGIIVLAIVWFVVVQIAKVAKRARRREAQDDAQREPQDVSRPARAPAETGGVQASVWDQITEMYEEAERARGYRNGYSDKQGCVGGSIEHDQHEGSFAPGSLKYTPTTEYEPVAFGETREKPRAARVRLTSAGMRGAVIAAEILGKPVTLRRD